MTTLLIIFLVILMIILALWLAGFLFATDFAVPVRDARQFRRVLVIFPHPDDEAVTCGGFLHRISRGGSAATVALLTKGEKGPNATHSSDLKGLRAREARTSAATLGVSKLIQEDFGDGALRQKRQELTTYLATLIEQERPDLLITHDRAGLYGHWDHITCSEIITELQATRFPEIPLWYVTFSKRILARVKMPEDLATDPHMREKQALPTHKYFIGANVWPKIRAWYAYKSQRAALVKGIRIFTPRWFLWFFLSMVLFEYFAEAS